MRPFALPKKEKGMDCREFRECGEFGSGTLQYPNHDGKAVTVGATSALLVAMEAALAVVGRLGVCCGTKCRQDIFETSSMDLEVGTLV
ncbi:unnamed protein product [Peronospora effusa]|uniref:Uncharacterized protein n=1 Tax=Peronospora effusa TaxID=542832 RepID=A0A3R7XPV3_9STRA|nr:hypothetical protein DD237_005787 [Peronospora effusa]CAI5728493.1 unnamed protein product [Peronospora effusa]